MQHYTPGPWAVSFEDLRGGRYWTVQRPGRDMEPIDIREDENGRYDAVLIAAAPDMYAALEAFVLMSSVDNIDAMIENAKAALAKARGE